MSKIQGWSFWLYVTLTMWAAIIFGAASLSGCGSELAAGGTGLAGGLVASKMFAGMQEDLEKREQDLIERYNAAVEAGAKSEVLDKIEGDIDKTVLLRQGAQAAKDVVEIVADGPGAEQYGAIAAIIASLGFNVYQKYKGGVMKKTMKAIVKGIDNVDRRENPKPEITAAIKKSIGSEMRIAGIFDRGNVIVDQLKVSRG